MGASFCYRCMAPLNNEETICPHCKGALPYVAADGKDIVPGTLVGARFIIGRSLGRGGFGATYLAFDLLTRMVCAVKEFFPDGMCQRGVNGVHVIPNAATEHQYRVYKSNFVDEARRLFSLTDHCGIVKVIQQFEENGTAYFAMEYIDGASLKEYLRRYPQGLMPREALEMIAQLLQALAAVHQNGLLHRDISADNVMRTRRGQIKLIDFGSARDTRKETKTVFTKGVYTAPEQKLGDKQRACTDLYAVGVLLFQLLVGRVPAVTDGVLESLRSAQKGLNEATYRLYEMATAMNPNCRYQHAGDMLLDLESALHTLPRHMKIKGKKAQGRGKHPAKNARQQRLKGYLAILGLVLLLLCLLLIIIGSL